MLDIQNPGSASAAPKGSPQGAPDCLAGLTFCITGKVEFTSKRSGLQDYISSLGGRNASSVTRNVDYLITNTPNSGSSKNAAAQALGCKVISEASFMRLVQERSAAQESETSTVASQENTSRKSSFQDRVEAVVIPTDPREARIQAAEVVQALTGQPLAGLTVCVTGKLHYGDRNSFLRFVESLGGSAATSVTRGVDYLVTNTPDSGTVKNRKAQANGCKVISEADFMRMARK